MKEIVLLPRKEIPTMEASAKVILFIIMLTASCALVSGQPQSAATSVADHDIDEFTREMLAAAAKENGQQAAKVELLNQREKEATDDWKRTTEEKAKANRDLKDAQTKVAATSIFINQGGGEQSIMGGGTYKRYERYVQLEAQALESVSQLNAQETTEKARLETVLSEKQAAKQELNQMESTRERQRNILKTLYDAWTQSKTDQNFKAVTSQLTQMAAPLRRTTTAEFISQDSASARTEGARINYETELDRKNNIQPVKATACTTVKPPTSPTCVKEDMPKGWYYIWAVRDQGATSDKNFYTRVTGDKSSITVVENK
jgi:hypothetical protein